MSKHGRILSIQVQNLKEMLLSYGVIKSQPVRYTCILYLVCADDLPRKRPPHIYKPPTPEMLAYLDFSVSTTGMLTGVKAWLFSFWLRNNIVWRVWVEKCILKSVFLSFRYLTHQSVLYVGLSNCSVSCTLPDRLPSAWTRTVAWDLCCGVCLGSINEQYFVINV